MTDYGTPRRVEYYDSNTWDYVTSEREYIPVDHVQGSVESPRGEYSYHETRHVQLTLYLDPLTGLVVYDIAAYEEYLKPIALSVEAIE